jgi:hypothetical protein
MSIRTALLARLKKGLSDIVHVLPTSMGTKVVAVAVVFFSIAILFVWIIGKQGDGRPVLAITLGPPILSDAERAEDLARAEKMEALGRDPPVIDNLKRLRDADSKDNNILMDIFLGKRSADEIAITHLGRRFEFMGQITGRDTEGDATVVAIENDAALCQFVDRNQRLAVSKIGRGCWMWTGTLSRVSRGLFTSIIVPFVLAEHRKNHASI